MKKLLTLILVLALIAGLAGCLDTSSTSSEAPADDTEAEAPMEAAEDTDEDDADEDDTRDREETEADVVLKLSTTITNLELTTVPNGMAVQYFYDGLLERTGGEVEMEMYLDGVLGSSTDELIGGAQNGAFEMIALAFGNWGDYTDGFAPLSIPYLFTSTEQVYQFVDGEIGDRMRARVEEDTGMVVLAFLDVGFRNITTNTGFIQSPDDMKGLKIRTMSDRYQMAAMEALGAAPTSIAFAELYSSLQQGLVDAQENPIINSFTSKFYEVQDYMTLTRHNYTFTVLAISRAALDTLTPEQQEIIFALGREAELVARESLVDIEEDLLGQLREVMEVYDPTIDELEAIREVAMTSWDIIEEDLGSDYFDEIVQEAERIADSLK